MGYVSADGNYGYDIAIIFDNDRLTAQQWQTLEELSDHNKLSYVRLILEAK